MENSKLKIGDKVEFYYPTKQGYKYGHGFIKVIQKNLLRMNYVIQLYKENDIFICEPKQIIGKVEHKNKD